MTARGRYRLAIRLPWAVLVDPVIKSSYDGGLQRSSALAFTNMVVMAAGMLFQPLIGVFLDMGWTGQVGPHNVHLFSTLNYQHALIVLPIGLVLAGLISLFVLKETYGEPLVEEVYREPLAQES